MANMIVAGIVILMIGAAGWYIYKAKKNGAGCVGCPSAGSCLGKRGSHPGCGCDPEERK